MSTDEQLLDLIKEGNVDDVVEFLDSKDLTGDHFRPDGETTGQVYREPFVTTAAACGDVDVIDALILRGFSAEEQHDGDSGSLQPIHAACRDGHLYVVRNLVGNHNVSVNCYSSTYVFALTPLEITVCRGKRNVYPIVEYLLKKGANLNGPGAYSYPLSVACIENPNAPPEVLELLISHGEDVNGGNRGPSPLHAAIDAGRVEFVEVLVDAGADGEIKSSECTLPFREHYPPSSGMKYSAIMRATDNNNLPVLKVLCYGGADPDYSNDCGISALHIAAAQGFYDIARHLIVDIGVALDRKDIFGKTPLTHAVVEMERDIVKLILKAGYDPKPEELEYDHSDPIFKTEGFSELLQEVKLLTSVPRTLGELCIFKLRQLLCRDLPDAVESLPVPNTLKNLIRLTHLP